jgi:hypothetical protein
VKESAANQPAGRWDIAALRAGASISLTIALPLAILSRVVADARGYGALSGPLFLAALAGFLLGGGVAAWHQRRGTPLSHALVSAVGTYAIAQAVIVIVNLVRDRPIRWLAIVFTVTLVSVVGLIGGLAGMALQRHGLEPKR